MFIGMVFEHEPTATQCSSVRTYGPGDGGKQIALDRGIMRQKIECGSCHLEVTVLVNVLVMCPYLKRTITEWWCRGCVKAEEE